METGTKKRMKNEIYAQIWYTKESGPDVVEEIYLKPKCGKLMLEFEGPHGQHVITKMKFTVRIFPSLKKGYYYFEAELEPAANRWKGYIDTIYNSKNYVTREHGRYGMLYKTPEEAKEGFLKTWELWIKTSYIRKYIKCYPSK